MAPVDKYEHCTQSWRQQAIHWGSALFVIVPNFIMDVDRPTKKNNLSYKDVVINDKLYDFAARYWLRIKRFPYLELPC